MTDDERVEQLAATLRLLFEATNDETVVSRAFSVAMPGWVVVDIKKYGEPRPLASALTAPTMLQEHLTYVTYRGGNNETP